MYEYDQHDQAMVEARVAEFRGQVARRLSGELTEDQFKPLRLKNGLYLQLHAYMLRVAVPYGTLSSAQMRVLGDIADKYDRGYGHFTTRQNIQYNWIKLSDAPQILEDLAKVQLHAIQTSGNCIRNTTSDHFAGAAADEVVDPRPYAELLRQWSTFHPEFDYLPRKFKVAIIASDTDRAAMRLHDIGIQIVKNEAGEIGCKFFAGGGMGRTPMIAPCIAEFVPALQMISFLEAALRVYNRHGRRDNKYKARIKILVHEIGVDEYARQVQEEFAHILTLGLEPPPAELERIKAMFVDPGLESGLSDDLDLSDPDFALWVDQNVHAHKQPGYAIVTISLKPVGGIPGDATADQIRLMADLARDHSLDELRVSHAQNIVLPHVKKADLYRVWQALVEAGLATPNLDLITDIIACPGLDYCALANARSIPGAEDHRPLRRHRAPARTGRTEAQDLGLHQRLRPPPCGPHRHSGGRSQGTGKLPAPARRRGKRRYLARHDHRAGLLGRWRRRCHREGHRRLPRPPRRGRAFPRHLPPHRHGPVQGGDLWLRPFCATAPTNPSPIRP
jgi:sulfite reductase (NADPH) hemoprotein beta-component